MINMIGKIHELKTLNPFFQAVKRELKTFEVRFNDRDFKVNDLVILREYDPDRLRKYTDNSILIKITYLLDDPKYCKEGYIIFGFEKIEV